jgi:hypothetical protein
MLLCSGVTDVVESSRKFSSSKRVKDTAELLSHAVEKEVAENVHLLK